MERLSPSLLYWGAPRGPGKRNQRDFRQRSADNWLVRGKAAACDRCGRYFELYHRMLSVERNICPSRPQYRESWLDHLGNSIRENWIRCSLPRTGCRCRVPRTTGNSFADPNWSKFLEA